MNIFILLQIFSKIQQNKKGKVKIFYCGNRMQGKAIRKHCERIGFAFSRETF